MRFLQTEVLVKQNRISLLPENLPEQTINKIGEDQKVKEANDEIEERIIFLYKIRTGSYLENHGVWIASNYLKEKSIISRALEIQQNLKEKGEIIEKKNIKSLFFSISSQFIESLRHSLSSV